MLKGLVLTPPVVGRIAIGRVVERDGKRLPAKDDEFSVTTQVQGRDGWVPHPLDAQLRKNAGNANAKLRAIPVRLLFDDPDLNLRAHYSLFDRATGRPLCVGNGETARRVSPDAGQGGIQSLPCPSPEGCSFGVAGGCKPYARLNVRIGEEDELGSFIFRTTGFNSIRSLAARLRYFHALSGGHLSALPLELRLRGKSTTQSHGTPIYYVDLTVRTGTTVAQALEAARAEVEARQAAGFDQAALDRAAREGFAAGAFEESVEEGTAVVEEFFPDEAGGDEPRTNSSDRGKASKPSLVAKLQRLVQDVGAPGGSERRTPPMRPSAEAPALMHTFAAGLRLDTELQFLARMPLGRTDWRRLPTPEVSDEGSAAVALMQAEAVVTGREPSARTLRRATQPRMQALTSEDLLRHLPELAPQLSATWHPGQSLLQADEPRCCPALACWTDARGPVWALVTGVEVEIRAGEVCPKALLLLDPRMPAPWSTGYNARLNLDRNQWQGLDGELQVANLQGLVELVAKD